MADEFALREANYRTAKRLVAGILLQAILDLRHKTYSEAAREWLDSETAQTCLEYLDIAPSKLQGALQRYPDGVGRREATRLAKVAALADKMQDFS